MINVGDRIEVESETLGRARRCGEVIGKDADRLHVKWDDGHESTFIPYAGNVRVLSSGSAGTTSGPSQT
ncbi:DUF1918 domain-containing protein [Microlunatus sp. Gsoil 973]|jgi:hypothetical protein|uniref:DUF1918 domain-containing protein n=1 Tax=Microlunatus sp. Gsoil 973 TaxID=2672569 RepID=UPI0012B4D60E|nr:DUF1918 domain-containing protein [Microlunatus sp. Gsoil 973]QGN32753.1 DUF1918 domain-containing protein [Microlunatus sp. Gsoil 973]